MIVVAGIVATALASLYFSCLTYAMRDYSRSRLHELLKERRREQWLSYIDRHTSDLVFVTAVWRLLSNTLLLIGVVDLFVRTGWPAWGQYLGAVAVASFISLIASIAVPTSAARYAAEPLLAISVRIMHVLRVSLHPLTLFARWIDRIVKTAAGGDADMEPEQIEKEILSVVEEGQKEGIVSSQERRMIESVIEFRDASVAETMTARPEIVALEVSSSLDEVKRTLEESGHSRVPVYDGTLDHIVGILYARDLLKHLGLPPDQFDMRGAMRPAIYVPETKPLGDLLREFRLQKVHIAIVLDEYGGTAGLVTIEDILEELVGEISDEHEPQEQPMLRKLTETTFEADARVFVDELNRATGLTLPEDAGYDTVGGFIAVTLGRIPARGATLDQGGARFTVLEAQPQRVTRVKVELLPQVVAAASSRRS